MTEAEKKGYRAFVRGGKTLSWEKAMALLHDKTGRPGPATWELGDYPEGQGDHPVTGVSWYEAAAYAAFVGKQLPNAYQWSRAAGTYLTQNIVPTSNFRNAGTVAVATIGAIGFEGRWDYGAIGTVTNLSARLCGEARGGQILVNPRAYAGIEAIVDAEPIEPPVLKGFQRPVPTFSVQGLKAG